MNKKLYPSFNEIINEIRKAIKNRKTFELAKYVKKEENHHPLYKSRNKYPNLPDFEITKADLAEIKELNKFPTPLISDRTWTPLEKFFYAVLWKDSKLKSIKLIIEGISDALNDHRAAPPKFVYYYLGRHLTNRLEEPLVDQHTMRARCLIQDKKIPAEFTDNDAKNYRRWFLKTCEKENLKNYEDTRLVDSLFFALGKYARSKASSAS